MTTIALDTHHAVQLLLAKGFSSDQAEGVVEVLSSSSLVTTATLDERFAAFEATMYRAMLIQTGAIAAIVFAMLKMLQV